MVFAALNSAVSSWNSKFDMKKQYHRVGLTSQREQSFGKICLSRTTVQSQNLESESQGSCSVTNPQCLQAKLNGKTIFPQGQVPSPPPQLCWRWAFVQLKRGHPQVQGSQLWVVEGEGSWRSFSRRSIQERNFASVHDLRKAYYRGGSSKENKTQASTNSFPFLSLFRLFSRPAMFRFWWVTRPTIDLFINFFKVFSRPWAQLFLPSHRNVKIQENI